VKPWMKVYLITQTQSVIQGQRLDGMCLLWTRQVAQWFTGLRPVLEGYGPRLCKSGAIKLITFVNYGVL
jgi:hypothetical protein